MQIDLEKPLVFSGQEFSAAEIIERLSGKVTSERFSRIQQVVGGRTHQVATVLEHIYDRGNISAVMRSAEAFGFLPFHIIEQENGQFKNSDRVSQGAEKWLDIHFHKKSTEAIEQLQSQGYKVYATHLAATKSLYDLDFTQKTALIFGNEKEGVSDEAISVADEKVILPMEGFSQSFNISVAAAISFSQAYSQRVHQLGASGDLSEEQKQSLVAHYLCRSLTQRNLEAFLSL